MLLSCVVPYSGKLLYPNTLPTIMYQLLNSACRIGRTETVNSILNETAADINCKDHWDSTPLYYDLDEIFFRIFNIDLK